MSTKATKCQMMSTVANKYNKIAEKIKNKINKEGKKILIASVIVKRFHCNGESNCFIVITDHKENFESKPSVRLINPTKNEIGRISKVIFKKLNVAI